MDTLANPLLDFRDLPRFDAIRPAHVAPAIADLLEEARAAVERVATDPQPATWERVVEPIADALDRLDRVWSAVRHLHAVVNGPELRDAYNASQPGVVAFFTDISQDLRLYAKYRELRESPSFASPGPALGCGDATSALSALRCSALGHRCSRCPRSCPSRA